jgi:hypothetical protein
MEIGAGRKAMSLHRRLQSLIFGLFIIAVAAVPQRIARADTAPKPTMHFDFVFEISPAPSIVSGVQEECGREDCSDARPLQDGGPQHFGCAATACSSLAYSYSEYHRLKITFSDGVMRQSNVFANKYFYANYRVAVRETDLLVEERQGEFGPFLSGPWILLCGCALLIVGFLLTIILLFVIAARAREFKNSRLLYVAAWLISLPTTLILLLASPMLGGLLFNLAIEMILAAVYTVWRKRSRALILTVVYLMNLFTAPVFIVIFGGVFFPGKTGIGWILGTEFFIWLVEAGFLALALRKEARFWEAALLSLALNATTFGAGLLLAF